MSGENRFVLGVMSLHVPVFTCVFANDVLWSGWIEQVVLPCFLCFVLNKLLSLTFQAAAASGSAWHDLVT